MRAIAVFLSFAVVAIAGCASSASTRNSNSIDVSGFAKLEGGGAYHKNTGLTCPATLNGAKFQNNSVIALDGSDITCSYGATDSVMTLYLTKSRGEQFKTAFAGSVLSAALVGAGQGLKLDNELSQMCTLSGLVSVATEKPTGAFSYESAVLKSDKGLSIVAMHPVADDFMKIRYTKKLSKTPTQDDAVKMCLETGKSMLLSSKAIAETNVKCSPTYRSIYQPPIKLGGAGRTIQIKQGEKCSLISDSG